MKRSHTSLAACALLAPGLLSAADWQCTPDIEVQCTREHCSTADNPGQPPINLSFDRRGTFSLCAYSGCWQGKGKVVSKAPFLVIVQARAVWSNPGRDAREDILISFDAQDQVALVKAGALAMPMRCTS